MLNQERKTQTFMSCSITFSEHYIHGNKEVRIFWGVVQRGKEVELLRRKQISSQHATSTFFQCLLEKKLV